MSVRQLGKLKRQAAVAVTAEPGLPGRLGLLRDVASGVAYLVDSGAVYSAMPHTSEDPPSGPRIAAADGSPIPCWGWENVVISCNGKQFNWRFLKAAVAFPLLGTDFLVHFGLLVDMANMRLVDKSGTTYPLAQPPPGGIFAAAGLQLVEQVPPPAAQVGRGGTTRGEQVQPPAAQVCTGAQPAAMAAVGPFYELLAKFPEVVNSSKQLPPVKHDVVHHIETSGRPVSAKYRRLDPARLAAAKKEFSALEAQGIIRRSNSQWSSPLHMVKKSDGSWRPCGDYRQLNLQTTPDRYPPPNIGDLTARLAGCSIFSKLDLRKGFFQIPVRPEDICKTAIVTPFGLYEFTRTAFGLRNAGQSFQRLMDRILAGLDFCFVYVDDILVASSSEAEHEHHLRLVLERLKEHGMVLNREKCLLGVAEIDYLGHRITASGISPMPQRVAAIKEHAKPTTARGLQTYLGMVNFYRRFLPAAAKVLRPLTEALKGAPKGRTWSGRL